ncbi:TauD/TfdA family dioxygenase [Micromonospora endophytica]|uniref:Uncharacterized protein n=1 Tax=Micromonospora endophytica TaxID=515350 RepID=A0A2W2CY55_9ACTN|nr:TauD/TfdA family dioxygenase [Micromonospora endophytica]PZF98294.1 hypothetical protein C1I93_09395 [Micromonospora endophytica]RIW42740.1 hypothetical protein D3H59_22150 [Micromonospora endophytica]BCJ62769.1 hypothetical protein Jiend_61910 [Micromonospora endophytica]
MLLLEKDGAAEIAADRVPDILARDGIVLIKHARVADVRALLHAWTKPVDHPHQSGAGMTIIAPRDTSDFRENVAGFSRNVLPPHTDRSLQDQPPSLVAALMLSGAPAGGEAVLVDGARVLRVHGRDHSASGLAGLRLATSDGRGDIAVVEKHAGLVRIRYRDDGVARPYSTDGRWDTATEFRQLIRATAETIHLAAGDGYLIHNHRILHGRAEFSGDRLLVRLLAKVRRDHPYAWLNRGFRFADS